MNYETTLTIYEYLDPNGDADAYICSGHIDSVRFREAVQEKYAVKPLVVQHHWRRSKRVVKPGTNQKRYRFRGYTTDVVCLSDDPGAYAVTVGLV